MDGTSHYVFATECLFSFLVPLFVHVDSVLRQSVLQLLLAGLPDCSVHCTDSGRAQYGSSGCFVSVSLTEHEENVVCLCVFPF